MSVKVKICGLANEKDVCGAAACEPDYLGFIFWPGSKRYVSPDDVGSWTRGLQGGAMKVGVFVDAPAKEINRTAEIAGLDLIQLHGSEPPDLIADLNLPAWKVIHLDRNQIEDVTKFNADALIVDSYTQDMPGGTGKVVDWTLARSFVRSAHRSVLLAGGLSPLNVEDAIRQVKPWGVDVCSGVEQSPGKKDLGQVREFIEVSRRL